MARLHKKRKNAEAERLERELLKQEEPKQEEPKQEEPKQEESKQEEPKQEEEKANKEEEELDDLMDKTNKELRKMLEEKELPTYGTKKELAERLLEESD